PSVRERYQRTLAQLADLDEHGYALLLDSTQRVVFDIGRSPDFRSADLGNPLRKVCADIRATVSDGMQSVVGEFQAAMAAVIAEHDRDIFRKAVSVSKHDRPTGRSSGPAAPAAER